MKIFLIIIGSVLAAISLVLLIGWLLPVKHKASRSLLLDAEIERVWQRLVSYENMPKWRLELQSVEQVGTDVWEETTKEGKSIAFATVEETQPYRLKREIVGEGLMFGGSWTFELRCKGQQTELTITENGEVYNPLFRFVAKYVIGHHRSMDKYMQQLLLSLPAT
ncbi:MAG: hypothetical protein OFPI_21040 [Osedax symbiont Rs2]|nr:MAG: hypothetical protein OFPI_21040 [Osedax symbiont Rs2]